VYGRREYGRMYLFSMVSVGVREERLLSSHDSVAPLLS